MAVSWGVEVRRGVAASQSGSELSGSESESGSEGDMDTTVPPIPIYTRKPGLTVSCGNSPLDYFSLFVDDSMLQHIVEQTNLNHEQYVAAHTLAPRSRIRRWSKVEHNIGELRKFIALILTMGLVRCPSIEGHWCTSWPYATNTFSSVSSTQYNCVP